MAADDPSKKSSKIVWRTCVLCTNRLSELCYDTHTKCEACRGQVCSDVSFCSECEGWSADFRKLYLKHKRSLLTKRVSKKNRKEGKSKGKSPSTNTPPQRADAPTPSDDAASVASLESHVTPPVVYLPLNQDIINANITVEQLQQFQQVDNIVEVQLENPPAPTTLPPQYDAAFYNRTDRAVTAIEKMLPLMLKMFADKESAKENKDDSANNPVVSPSVSAPQVPVVAPQDPGSAPGPSYASLEPLASTSGLQQPHQHAIASPRGRSGERVISERSRHASPSFQDRLKLHIDDVRRQLSNTIEIADLYSSQGRLPPDQVSHDIGYLQDRLSHLQSSLEDSLASSLGIGPSTSAHAVASPAPTPVASGSSTSRFSSRHDRRYDQRVASSDIHALSGRPCSRESTQTSPRRPSSQRFSSSRRSLSPCRTPSPTRRRSASRRTPSPTKRRDTSRRTPSPAQRSTSRRTPSPQRRAASKGSSRSRKRSSRDSLSPRRGSPPPKRQRRQERDSVSPPVQHSSRASSREPSQERPGSRSPHGQTSPSREEKEADDAPISATVKAMVDFIKSNFPDAVVSPSQKSSRSFDLSVSVGVSDPDSPSGSLLGWSQVMSDSFTETQKKFSKRIQEGRACHTLLPSVNRLEKVANSPSQGKELIANPDVLDLLRNKVPDFRHLPISVKESIALERTLRSVLESESFLTWSVMGILKSLHLKSLLPKDNPVLTQLQKSFSKASNNVASGLTSSAAFLTLKRRQLLLSHVVPSVSEAQKRNLRADPFFQTSSLFDASSLESARSAARDMSLFKPHLKASTSSSQGRRQGPSTASHRRGAARQYSGASSSQRASSPFRQQSGKKGDARFHKKSSGTPQKRGGFRK